MNPVDAITLRRLKVSGHQRKICVRTVGMWSANIKGHVLDELVEINADDYGQDSTVVRPVAALQSGEYVLRVKSDLKSDPIGYCFGIDSFDPS